MAHKNSVFRFVIQELVNSTSRKPLLGLAPATAPPAILMFEGYPEEQKALPGQPGRKHCSWEG